MKQKGFTIIELMVAISIIAVLAGIVISNIRQYQAKANNAAILQKISNIQKALEMYKSQYGVYPYQAALTGTAADDPAYVNGADLYACWGHSPTFIGGLTTKLVNTGIIGNIQDYTDNPIGSKPCTLNGQGNNFFHYSTSGGDLCNSPLVNNPGAYYYIYIESQTPLTGLTLSYGPFSPTPKPNLYHYCVTSNK